MIHIDKLGCGQHSPISMTLGFIVAHVEWAAVLMVVLGCRRCVAAMEARVLR